MQSTLNMADWCLLSPPVTDCADWGRDGAGTANRTYLEV